MTGRELRRLRLKLGLTQKELAKRLDLAERSLGRYESGRRPITRILAMAVRWLAEHGPAR